MNVDDVLPDLRADGGGAIGAVVRDIARPDLEIAMFAQDEQLNSTGAGPDAFIGLWRDWTGSFARFSMEQVREPIENGGRIVNTTRQSGWIEGSDAPITA